MSEEFEGRPELQAQDKRTLLARNFLLTILVLWMIAVPGFLTWNAIEGSRSRNLLLDCTTAGGKCYAEQNKRSLEFIKQIIDEEGDTQKIVVLAAYCAKVPGNDTAESVEKCVNERLKK
jgi:hypothetical protein